MPQCIKHTAPQPKDKPVCAATDEMHFEATLPTTGCVDFSNPDEAAAYGHLLMSAYRHLRCFSTGNTTAIANGISDNAGEWVRRVERHIASTPPRGITTYLQWYDLVHRLASGQPALTDFTDRWVAKAFKSMLQGEDTDITALMHLLRHKLNHNTAVADASQLRWYSAVADRWMREAMHPTPFIGYSAAEALRIVGFICDEDLFVWLTDQLAFKTELTGRYLSVTDHIDGKTTPALLESVLTFSLTASRYYSSSDCTCMRSKALRLLSTHPALSPIARHAYTLDLAFSSIS